MKTFKKIIEELVKQKKTIATMESCTGGGVANAITNIEGASDVLKYSAVTYSNEYKIKMGVTKETIDTFSVYSMETARNMAEAISDFAKANIGVGITGKLNRVDKNNPYGEDNVVFLCIFDKDKNEYYESKVEAIKSSRKLNKDLVIEKIIEIIEKNVL